MVESATDVVRVEEAEAQATSADELIARSDITPDDVAQADEMAVQAARGRPAVTLTEYQHEIVACARRFIAMMVCRQGGKTFASTLRVARKILAQPFNYYILSRSERQSANAIAQTAVHIRAVERALRAKGKRVASAAGAKYAAQKVRYHRADGSAFDYTRLSIQSPTGAKAIGLPASADTVVGITGSVYGDEFALHRDSREIYKRLFPVLTRRAEYEMVLTSTPRGIGNKFHEIMTSPDYAEIFHRITVDIHTAVAKGLRLRDYNGEPIIDAAGIERLRKALKDDEGWREEYLCQFVDDISNLLSYELIGRCERLHTPGGAPYTVLELPADFDPARDKIATLLASRLGKGELYIGFDQARHRDLSVIWIDEDVGGESWARALLTMKSKDFEFQEALLWQCMELPNVRLAGIDSTGLGERTAERAVTRFGTRVVPVNFSSKIKDRQGALHPAKALLARVILERHQDGHDRYPVLDAIRDDFHKVKRKRGASPDSFSYFADDDETGHADIFTAKALADYVAQELREYAGVADGIRIVGDEPTAEFSRLRPDPNQDGRPAGGDDLAPYVG